MDVIATAWDALNDVHDPCSTAIGTPISLVDMKIVRSVDLTETGIRVELQLTEPSCIFAFHIVETAEQRLRDALGATTAVEVRLAHDYPDVWTEDAIAPAARARLELARSARQLSIRPIVSTRSAS